MAAYRFLVEKTSETIADHEKRASVEFIAWMEEHVGRQFVDWSYCGYGNPHGGPIRFWKILVYDADAAMLAKLRWGGTSLAL